MINDSNRDSLFFPGPVFQPFHNYLLESLTLSSRALSIDHVEPRSC